VSLDDLDLLRPHRFDPWAAALLDIAADPDATALQAFRLETLGGKAALVAFQNRDREILRPAPPEIHVDGCAAFADRQHPALDDGEATAIGRDSRRILGAADGIVRF